MAKKKNIISPAATMADKKHVSGSVTDPKSEIIKMAKEVRSAANSMSDDKREESFNHGMRLIYGGSSHVAAKVGRP